MVVLDSFPFQEDSSMQFFGEATPEVETSDDRTQFDPAVQEEPHCVGSAYPPGYLKCRLCHYQTEIHSLFRRHVIKHSLDSNFCCPACGFRESDAGKFVEHIGTHQSGRLVRCCFCPKKMCRWKLKRHVGIHRPVELYDCSMCQFSTNYEKTIKKHMDVYHSKEHACQLCDKVMAKHDLHGHMKSVHGSTDAQFDLPGHETMVALTETDANSTPTKPHMKSRSFSTSRTLYSTISRKPSFAGKSQKFAVGKKYFPCDKCDYKTAFKKLLRDHRAKHSLENSLICSKCKFKETSTGKFALHLLLAHSPEGLVECCFCGFQTPRRDTMANHLWKHKPLAMFDCSECEFSARRPASLRVHMANVHKKKKMHCAKCGAEVSKLGWFSHRLECHERTVDPIEPTSESRPDGSLTVSEAQDDNCVPCELCKKLYAKSYVRRHYKLCRGEPASNPESDPLSEDGPVSSDDQVIEDTADLVSESHPDGSVTVPEGHDDNCVLCEFCKKLYAKSYVRKHYKRCRGEPASNPESDPLPGDGPVSRDDQVIIEDTADLAEWRCENSISLMSHCTRNNKKPTLQCSSCSFETKKKCLLKKHVLKHLIDFRLTCPECGYKEMSSYKFGDHIIQHKGGRYSKSFQCCICQTSALTSRRSLISHLELHRPVNIFDCPKCEYSGNRSDSVSCHYINNHIKRGACRFCSKSMSLARLKKHIIAAHSESKGAKRGTVEGTRSSASFPTQQTCTNDEPADGGYTDALHPGDGISEPEICNTEIQPLQSDIALLQCSKCPFVTKIQPLMDRHNAKHLMDVPFICPLCGFEEINSRKFAHHWDKHECNTNKKQYPCCFCDTPVKKKNCLKSFLPQHIEAHRAVALQDCSDCEFSCHSRYELVKHFKQQHQKKCECVLCGEVMTVYEYSFHADCKGGEGANQPAQVEPMPSSALVKLRRLSEGVQSIFIETLKDSTLLAESVTFSTTAASKQKDQPLLINTETYLYCNTCDYKTQLNHLHIRHVQKHLIDVPFTCLLCSFATFEESTFVDHVFSHTGSYKCQFCSSAPKCRSDAVRHCISHRFLAMHDCPRCEFTSTYKESLIQHLRGRHTENPRCSFCRKKSSKEEILIHETECQKSLTANSLTNLPLQVAIPTNVGQQPPLVDSEGSHINNPKLVDRSAPCSDIEQHQTCTGLEPNSISLVPVVGHCDTSGGILKHDGSTSATDLPKP